MDELIDALASTPGSLAMLVADRTDAELDDTSAGWSPRTILAHFRDDEVLCTRLALSRLLAEHNPELGFIDGADWEPDRNRTRDRKEQLLADFALQRQASVSMLRMLRPEDWERAGTRNGRRMTVHDLVLLWLAHDSEHLAQLEQILGETVAEARARRARRD